MERAAISTRYLFASQNLAKSEQRAKASKIGEYAASAQSFGSLSIQTLAWRLSIIRLRFELLAQS
jgi:hypothetical protein